MPVRLGPPQHADHTAPALNNLSSPIPAAIAMGWVCQTKERGREGFGFEGRVLPKNLTRLQHDYF